MKAACALAVEAPLWPGVGGRPMPAHEVSALLAWRPPARRTSPDRDGELRRDDPEGWRERHQTAAEVRAERYALDPLARFDDEDVAARINERRMKLEANEFSTFSPDYAPEAP